MLILGIIFITIGIFILQWYAKFANMGYLYRPIILSRPVPVLIMNIFSIGFLITGLILLWKVNYIIGILIILCFLVLSFYGSFLRSEKGRARLFFKIYKMLRTQKPTAEEKDIIADALLAYIKQCKRNEYSLVYHGLSEAGIPDEIIVVRYIRVTGDIKEVAANILRFEKSCPHGPNAISDSDCYEKESLKREKIINKAYREVFN